MSRIEFGLKEIVRFFAKLVKTHGFIAGINTIFRPRSITSDLP